MIDSNLSVLTFATTKKAFIIYENINIYIVKSPNVLILLKIDSYNSLFLINQEGGVELNPI